MIIRPPASLVGALELMESDEIVVHVADSRKFLIVASALQADCDQIWPDDMQGGMMIEAKLRILNPFHARFR